MKRFLEDCAKYVFTKYGSDLQEICIVFPNRRAGVFYTAYFQKLLNKPVIGPDLTTIGALMQSFSGLIVPERLILIARLYEVYQKVTGFKETFDDFFFWGEILLADFDDIDKYRVNARHLFQNISEIKEIERHFDYLTEQQKEMLEQFWGSLKNWESREQQRNFVSFCNRLYDIYAGYKDDLLRKGIGYQGMVIRDGIERVLSGKSLNSYKKYIFVGHNALNECEKQLFSILKTDGKADFLWDYDTWYVSDPVNDAGKFMRENLLMFPPPEDFQPDTDVFVQPKEIQIVSVPSSVGQSQVIPEFFESIGDDPNEGELFDKTAVVLADESLLFPVLGALPGQSGNINVTMGYPVKNSPVNGFLYLLAMMLRNTPVEPGEKPRLYFRLVFDILNHQLLTEISKEKVHDFMQKVTTHNQVYVSPDELDFSPLHQLIFSLPETVSGYPAYFLRILGQLYKIAAEKNQGPLIKELIYHLYISIEKLQLALTEAGGGIEITPAIFFRLMNQYLAKVNVPFEGEPLSGIQVMGILETRCLDFENLLIIGLNEETWPRAITSPSLIPYNLRKSFGLPGIDDQDAMYAYYFYRLIQRSKRITATWNTIREGISGGELSRYGFQLRLLSPHKVNSRSLDFQFSDQSLAPIVIRSGSQISEKLLKMNADGRILSPSAINTFLSCSLRFYFRYVLNIEEPDEVAEEIDRRVFGNIFHKAVENLYSPFIGKTLDAKTITDVTSDKKNIDLCIQKAFATEYFKKSENEAGTIQIEGKAKLIFSTIRSYILNLLEIDKENSPIGILSLESYYEAPFNINLNGKQHTIRIGGKIDRLDSVAGSIRVIDYKTGSIDKYDLSCKDLYDLVNADNKKQKKEIVQALIYGLILRKKYYPDISITATVYSILKLKDESFNSTIRMDNKAINMSEAGQEWESILSGILENIYSPEAIFSQTVYKDRCGYCPYKLICGR